MFYFVYYTIVQVSFLAKLLKNNEKRQYIPLENDKKTVYIHSDCQIFWLYLTIEE